MGWGGGGEAVVMSGPKKVSIFGACPFQKDLLLLNNYIAHVTKQNYVDVNYIKQS